MRIEPGEKTDEPIRTRGWTHWHHLFNPRQLLLAGWPIDSGPALEVRSAPDAELECPASRWSIGDGDGGSGGVIAGVRQPSAEHAVQLRLPRKLFALDLFSGNYKSWPCRAAFSPDRKRAGRSEVRRRPLHHRSAVRRRRQVRRDPGVFHCLDEKEPAGRLCRLGVGQPPDARHQGRGRRLQLAMVAAYQPMTETWPTMGCRSSCSPTRTRDLGGHGQHRVGLGIAGDRRLVRRHRDRAALRDGQYVKGTILLVLRKPTERLAASRRAGVRVGGRG